MIMKYRAGTPLMADYTPGSGVSAGDVIVVGNEVRIAHNDIEANVLGALALPSGDTIYEGTKLTSDDVADGAQLYWDAGNSRLTVTSSTHKKAGIAVAAAGTSATTCLFRHQSV